VDVVVEGRGFCAWECYRVRGGGTGDLGYAGEAEEAGGAL